MSEVKIINGDVVRFKSAEGMKLLGYVNGYSVNGDDVKTFNIDANGKLHNQVSKDEIIDRYTKFVSRTKKVKQEQLEKSNADLQEKIDQKLEEHEIPELPESHS